MAASMPYIMVRKASAPLRNASTALPYSWKKSINRLGYKQVNAQYFDTLRFALPDTISAQQIRTIALSKEVNLRYFKNGDVGMSIDETTDITAVNVLLSIFAIAAGRDWEKASDVPMAKSISAEMKRQSAYLTHEVFNKYHTETEMMRYIKRLDRKDISLAHSMISLGSCTMKLNAAARDAAAQPSGIHEHASPGAGRPGRRLPRTDKQPQ